jgi:hypothetical protein
MSMALKAARVAAAVGIVASGTSFLMSGSAPASAAPTADAVSPNMAIAVGPPGATLLSTPGGCHLNGVQHVFYIGFDNFHLRRDNSNTVANNGDDNHNTDTNIPSDLEQVPALYNFLRGTTNTPTTTDTTNYADGRNRTYTDTTAYSGGTVLGNHHTPLISHTSVDFTAAYTGVYGDRNGIATTQNNIAAYNGSTYTGGTTAAAQSVGTNSNGGFGLWTDPLNIGTDTTPQYLTTNSSNTVVNGPAPWVPFTRAGCDVGAVAATTMVLENNNSLADVNAVAPTGTTFNSGDEGLAVHCAVGSSICGLSATDPGVKEVPDNLPAEPGAPYSGAAGYFALYGHRFIAPALNDSIHSTTTGGSTTLGLLRAPSTNAFPGFNGEDGNYTLGYTLAMQKAGIPVTFGYLTTAHNCYFALDGASTTSGWTPSAVNDYGGTTANPCNHTDAPSTVDSGTSSSFGSGEQGYVDYLAQLNTDFQAFFDQAKAAGFTTANTEFVFYSDENDHVSEGTPVNSTCDGVTTACQYNHSSTQTTPTSGQLGEVTVKLDTPFPRGGATSYTILADSAPDFYLEEQGNSGPPGQTDTQVRTFERTMGSTTYPDPYTGATKNIVSYMADQTGLNALHMITADPNRSPTFDVFAPGEDFVESGFPTDCGGAANMTCSNAGFPYVHGDFAPETTTTWASFAGPGVANLGVDTTDWNDHVDLRPTLLALTGLQDDYSDEGRVLTEILNSGVVNADLTTSSAQQLGSMLKQLDAPNYGATETSNTGFGPATLVSDTEALQSNATGDSTYTDVEGRISTITGQRNTVVGDIQALLAGAATGTPIDSGRASTDITNGQCLLAYANQLKTYALNPTPANAPTACMISAAIVPEAPHSVLLVLSAGLVLAGGLLLVGRRRRVRA